jgi:hypothetical protein
LFDQQSGKRGGCRNSYVSSNLHHRQMTIHVDKGYLTCIG